MRAGEVGTRHCLSAFIITPHALRYIHYTCSSLVQLQSSARDRARQPSTGAYESMHYTARQRPIFLFIHVWPFLRWNPHSNLLNTSMTVYVWPSASVSTTAAGQHRGKGAKVNEMLLAPGIQDAGSANDAPPVSAEAERIEFASVGAVSWLVRTDQFLQTPTVMQNCFACMADVAGTVLVWPQKICVKWELGPRCILQKDGRAKDKFFFRVGTVLPAEWNDTARNFKLL